MKVLVTGATGLIGRNLCRALAAADHHIVALSRAPEKAKGLNAATVYKWDGIAGPPPVAALQGINSVVNLAGEPIADHRWSPEQKKRIRDSRVISTRNLVEGLRQEGTKPASLVSGSAVGFYGDREDEILDENSPAGRGFLSDVCSEWEEEAERASSLGVRVVRVRTGVVLSATGGALKKMLPAFKLGIAGRLGSGRQWLPWIHIIDLVSILHCALLSNSLSGPINATAPEPARNSDFTRELAHVLRRPAVLPLPSFALHLMMGEMSEILLGGQRAIPKALEQSGFEFRFRTLSPALEDLLGRKNTTETYHGKAADV